MLTDGELWTLSASFTPKRYLNASAPIAWIFRGMIRSNEVVDFA
jgi:hypothetical protein